MIAGSGLTHCSGQERAGWETVYLRRVRFCREGRGGEPPSFWAWLGGGPTATSQRKAQLASTWALVAPAPRRLCRPFLRLQRPRWQTLRGPHDLRPGLLAVGRPAGHSASSLLSTCAAAARPLAFLLAPRLPVWKTAPKIPAAALRVFEEQLGNCLWAAQPRLKGLQNLVA